MRQIQGVIETIASKTKIKIELGESKAKYSGG